MTDDFTDEQLRNWVENVAEPTVRDLAAALLAERELREKYQRERAELFDKLNGTPCEQIRHQQEIEGLRAAMDECGDHGAGICKRIVTLEAANARLDEALRNAIVQLGRARCPDRSPEAQTENRRNWRKREVNMMADKRDESTRTTEKTTTEKSPAPPFGRGTEERTTERTTEKVEKVEK